MNFDAALPIALVEDDPFQRRLLQESIESTGLRVLPFPDAETFLHALDELPDLGVLLIDVRLPGINGVELLIRMRQTDPELPTIIVSGQDRVEIAIQAMQAGAWDYIVKPFESYKLELALRKALDRRLVGLQLARLRKRERRGMGRIIGDSPEMQKIFTLLQSAMRNDMTVLIQGESGTGKELVAKAIHENGTRADGPFVSINCAAIPRELMESEMFGHEKGAFTGAVARRVGRFEEANGGTLFLDEIGELDPSLQAKLLRVLQEREIQRVGGSTTVPVNVRVVSATKQNLAQRAMTGQFREDLYYRINAFTIQLPALRERHMDVALLANYFFAKHRESMGRTDVNGLSPEAMEILDRCPWPGNVRQLENAVCRALAMTDGPLIDLKDLPVEVREGHGPQQMLGDVATASGRAMVESLTDLGPMASIRQQAILAALEASEYNVQAAARKLGVSRGTLYRHLPKQFRDGSGVK